MDRVNLIGRHDGLRRWGADLEFAARRQYTPDSHFHQRFTSIIEHDIALYPFSSPIGSRFSRENAILLYSLHDLGILAIHRSRDRHSYSVRASSPSLNDPSSASTTASELHSRSSLVHVLSLLERRTTTQLKTPTPNTTSWDSEVARLTETVVNRKMMEDGRCGRPLETSLNRAQWKIRCPKPLEMVCCRPLEVRTFLAYKERC